MAMHNPLAGNALDDYQYGDTQPYGEDFDGYMDVSMMAPESQYEYLVSLLAAEDYAHPAQDTMSPPAGEYTDPVFIVDETVIDHAYMPSPDFSTDADAVDDIFQYAPGPDIPERVWWNDPQFHGLGVPPGFTNDQPFESGHTQITLPNPSEEQGWDAWSGRAPMARTAYMGNSFPGYGHDVNRNFGERRVLKYSMPLVLQTQQYRDLLLSEIKVRGQHTVVVDDVASVPYTQQVQSINPLELDYGAPIGEEGVTDW